MNLFFFQICFRICFQICFGISFWVCFWVCCQVCLKVCFWVLYSSLFSNVYVAYLGAFCYQSKKLGCAFSFLDASTHLYKRVCPSVRRERERERERDPGWSERVNERLTYLSDVVVSIWKLSVNSLFPSLWPANLRSSPRVSLEGCNSAIGLRSRFIPRACLDLDLF